MQQRALGDQQAALAAEQEALARHHEELSRAVEGRCARCSTGAFAAGIATPVK